MTFVHATIMPYTLYWAAALFMAALQHELVLVRYPLSVLHVTGFDSSWCL